MNYRRNADADLRSLERTLASDPGNRELLRQVDRIRQRAGMPPHPLTRIEVATDRQEEMQYQSYMILRDLAPILNEILVNSEEVRLLTEVFNDRQYVTKVQDTVITRQRAMEDAMQSLRGAEPDRHYLAFLRDHQIKVKDWAKNPERFAISDGFRREADVKCRELLNSLSRIGVLNGYSMGPSFEEREEDLQELLLKIETTLDNWDLAHEEVYRARLGEDPTPAYKVELGDDYWWRHLA